MAEQALGWLGWSEDQALSADVNTILVAMNGKRSMLNAVLKPILGIFGIDSDASAPAKAPLTPALFRAMFSK